MWNPFESTVAVRVRQGSLMVHDRGTGQMQVVGLGGDYRVQTDDQHVVTLYQGRAADGVVLARCSTARQAQRVMRQIRKAVQRGWLSRLTRLLLIGFAALVLVNAIKGLVGTDPATPPLAALGAPAGATVNPQAPLAAFGMVGQGQPASGSLAAFGLGDGAPAKAGSPAVPLGCNS